MSLDVIIIGGSYAGLAAALQLARARRQILVVDGGKRRNRFAGHSNGFMSRDGEEAAAIAAIGREQLLAYSTVQWVDDEVVGAERTDDGFRVVLAQGAVHAARRLVLATGVSDTLPDIPGLVERWGTSVFHCPYCHGYELDQGRIGVLATSPGSLHMGLLLPDWGPTTFLLNGSFDPDTEQLEKLRARGVTVDRGLIDRVEGNLTVVMRDGRSVELDGLFTPTRVAPASPIAEQLGCQIDENAMGRVVVTDPMKATTVPGVYACGDVARFGGALPIAVGDGAMAGGATHQSLIFGTAK